MRIDLFFFFLNSSCVRKLFGSFIQNILGGGIIFSLNIDIRHPQPQVGIGIAQFFGLFIVCQGRGQFFFRFAAGYIGPRTADVQFRPVRVHLDGGGEGQNSLAVILFAQVTDTQIILLLPVYRRRAAAGQHQQGKQ